MNTHDIAEIFRSVFIIMEQFLIDEVSDSSEVSDSEEVSETGMTHFKAFHGELLERGVYIGPSGFEVGFVSKAHSYEDLVKGASAMKEALDVIFG